MRGAARTGIALLLGLSVVASAGGPPESLELGARLPEGAQAAEHWDLAAHFDSGHRLYARFLLTNAGPGERAALAFGHLLLPSGESVAFRNGRRAGRWQLSDAGRRIVIGSSVLALGRDTRHFEVDNDKRGIKIHLDLPADGSAQSAPEAPGGYRVELLNLASAASGRFWLEGMPAPQPLVGRALLTHTWFAAAEQELVSRRLDLAILTPGAPIFASELQPPEGEPWRWLVAGGRSWTSRGGRLELRSLGRRGRDYPIPDAIEVRGKGLDGRFSLGRTLLELDPLDALPVVLRMVYSFGDHPRHLWVEADADIALKSPDEDAVLRWQGEGVALLVFLHPRPPSDR